MLNVAFGLVYQPHFHSSVAETQVDARSRPHKNSKTNNPTVCKELETRNPTTIKTQNSMVHSACHDHLVVTSLPTNHVINPQWWINLWPWSLLKNPWRQKLKVTKEDNGGLQRPPTETERQIYLPRALQVVMGTVLKFPRLTKHEAAFLIREVDG